MLAVGTELHLLTVRAASDHRAFLSAAEGTEWILQDCILKARLEGSRGARVFGRVLHRGGAWWQLSGSAWDRLSSWMGGARRCLRPLVALCQAGCKLQDPQKALEIALWADTGALGPGAAPSSSPASELIWTEKKPKNFIIHTTGGQPWGQRSREIPRQKPALQVPRRQSAGLSYLLPLRVAAGNEINLR